jgi:hypothetical protein
MVMRFKKRIMKSSHYIKNIHDCSLAVRVGVTVKMEALPTKSGKCSYADSLNAQKITDSLERQALSMIGIVPSVKMPTR